MTFFAKYPSPIGELTLLSDGEALTGLDFEKDRYPNKITSEMSCASLPVFEEAFLWLDIYFRGENPGFMPKLLLKGSPFRMEVWDILRKIPYGETVTYGEIADEIAAKRGLEKMSAQAVGGAVGHNPIGIIVPCHRVVGSGGSLTGFGGGIEAKIFLLKIEGAYKENFYIPKGVDSGSPKGRLIN